MKKLICWIIGHHFPWEDDSPECFRCGLDVSEEMYQGRFVRSDEAFFLSRFGLAYMRSSWWFYFWRQPCRQCGKRFNRCNCMPF